MTEVISVEGSGAQAARVTLERTITAGGVAIFPADGLYGLACDPLDAAAIARIHEIKGRDDGKPSAVMYFSPLAMRELVQTFGSRTREAVGVLLPGPLTLVVANPEHRYPLACREDLGRLGIRLIEGPLTGAMCPLFQTSANRSGEPPAGSFERIPTGIIDEVDLAIDGGELTGQPSSVIDLTAFDGSGEWWVLREGAVGGAELEERLAGIAPAAQPGSGGSASST